MQACPFVGAARWAARARLRLAPTRPGPISFHPSWCRQAWVAEMAIPLRQSLTVSAYVMRQLLGGNRRFALVLQLEPLYQCNLACAGCGKIQHPEDVLARRLSVQQCIDAVEECGAPIVSIAGGEPLIHREIDQVVAALIERKRFVYLCTNAILMGKKLDQFRP